MPKGQIRVGIGGWDFDPWRDNFYPKGLAKTKQLGFAADKLTAIEINATYYRSQKPETFANWAKAVPDGFGRGDPLPELDHRFLNPFQVHAVVDMTHMVDVVGPNADRVMKCLAHLGRIVGVTDNGVNIVTGRSSVLMRQDE